MRLIKSQGEKNESKKNIINLLKNLSNLNFKYRLLDGKVDILFPEKETFIYLDKTESFIFIYLFVKKRHNLNELSLNLQKKYKIKKDNSIKKIEKFLDEINAATSL